MRPAGYAVYRCKRHACGMAPKASVTRIRRIFRPSCAVPASIRRLSTAQPRYRSIVEDPIWYALYLPIAALVERGTPDRLPATGPNRDLPALQLRHPAGAAGADRGLRRMKVKHEMWTLVALDDCSGIRGSAGAGVFSSRQGMRGAHLSPFTFHFSLPSK